MTHETCDIEGFINARDCFRALPCIATARAYRLAAHRRRQEGGSEQYPSGFPESQSYVSVMDETKMIMQRYLVLTDDPADCHVKVEIRANLLVTVLNSAATRCQPGSENWQTIEAIRDALSDARMSK